MTRTVAMPLTDPRDRRIAAWLSDEMPAHAPDHLLSEVLGTAARTRRRPAWRIPERWIPMSLKVRLAVIPPGVTVLLIVLLAAVAAAAVMATSPSPAPRVPPPTGVARNGLIAFDSNGDLFVVNQDGTDVRQLTSGPARETSPLFSPDGLHIAYLSVESGLGQVVAVANADGTGQVVVSGDAQFYRHEEQEQPSWSPSSHWLAFAANEGQDRVLAIAAADGSSVRTIEVGGLNPRYAVWSPDGTRIAFRGDWPAGDVSKSGIYVVNVDGTGLVRVAATPSYTRSISAPSWSPDGTRIAYDVVDLGSGLMDIAVAPVDGSGARLIANDALDECCASWSPDGAWIAFLRGNYPDLGPTGAWEYEMFLVRPDGTDLEQLGGPNAAKYEPGPPIWSPDATRILDYGIYDADPKVAYPNIIITVDGDAPTVTVPGPNSNGQASWQRLAP
jgi:dipeptidyl aminopeptidase/acylaminoacyl peptidase